MQDTGGEDALRDAEASVRAKERSLAAKTAVLRMGVERLCEQLPQTTGDGIFDKVAVIDCLNRASTNESSSAVTASLDWKMLLNEMAVIGVSLSSSTSRGFFHLASPVDRVVPECCDARC